MSLKQHLEKEGYEVFTAESGEEGLEVFRTEIPDIILLDIHLPGISGLETLEAIRKINKEVIVVIITAHGGYRDCGLCHKTRRIRFCGETLRY